MKIQTKKLNKESGFVILFSILISTIILLMSAGIFRVAQKETILSSYSRESQIAFYAADAAVECALYWDISQLEVTKFPSGQADETETESFTCGTDTNGDSLSIKAYKYLITNGVYDHVFGFRYGNLGDDFGCAFTFVEKNDPTPPVNPTDPLSRTETRITAVGYNACDGDIPDLDDPTLLERRLTVSYSGL